MTFKGPELVPTVFSLSWPMGDSPLHPSPLHTSAACAAINHWVCRWMRSWAAGLPWLQRFKCHLLSPARGTRWKNHIGRNGRGKFRATVFFFFFHVAFWCSSGNVPQNECCSLPLLQQRKAKLEGFCFCFRDPQSPDIGRAAGGHFYAGHPSWPFLASFVLKLFQQPQRNNP